MPISAAEFDRVVQTEEEAFAERVVRVLRENQAQALTSQEIAAMLLGRAQNGRNWEFASMVVRVEGALDTLAKEKTRRVESKEVGGPLGEIYYRAKRSPSLRYV